MTTWLTRIVINEALGRLRSDRRRRARLEAEGVSVLDTYREKLMAGSETPPPDAAVAREQLRSLMERAVAELPDLFRTAFVLREIDGLSVEETAEVLNVPAATVKTRLLRAKRRLQEALDPDVHEALSGTFPFAGTCCAELTKRVMVRLGYLESNGTGRSGRS